MRLALALLNASVLLAACAAETKPSLEDRTLAFSCKDTIAIARVKNGAFQAATSADDLLGHGWVSATLTVSKVVRGPVLPQTIAVRYFAHTYMNESRDFMLVVGRADDGVYQIKRGQLMSRRPLPSNACG